MRPTPTATRMARRVSRKPTAVLTLHPPESDLLNVVLMSGSTYLFAGATVTAGRNSTGGRSSEAHDKLRQRRREISKGKYPALVRLLVIPKSTRLASALIRRS
ncbi:hypothetical protein RRG08_024617 [Elysia crispata]|uniref:Uncharacterized protein n=1 Tax=Elysia crispata TaxID=231223 RepID=A0AAE0ZW92_9GAST|nr:hypothetical protein RRG08_024617 [Elysia crispata]